MTINRNFVMVVGSQIMAAQLAGMRDPSATDPGHLDAMADMAVRAALALDAAVPRAEERLYAEAKAAADAKVAEERAVADAKAIADAQAAADAKAAAAVRAPTDAVARELEARGVGRLPLSAEQIVRRDDLASREVTLTPHERTELAMLRSYDPAPAAADEKAAADVARWAAEDAPVPGHSPAFVVSDAPAPSSAHAPAHAPAHAAVSAPAHAPAYASARAPASAPAPRTPGKGAGR